MFAGEIRKERYPARLETSKAAFGTVIRALAVFIYRDLGGDLHGSGLVVVSFDNGGELAKQFADVWFEKSEAFMKEGIFNKEND